ncbi:hypothetical protein LB506_008295 [Fusarium annulatum]|nr:hypothetical protein LB506_008295 [Fusarium annulatum]
MSRLPEVMSAPMDLSIVTACGTAFEWTSPILSAYFHQDNVVSMESFTCEEPKRNILRAPAFDSAQVACSAVIAMDHVVF